MPPTRRHCRRIGAHYSPSQLGTCAYRPHYAHTIHDRRTTRTRARDHHAASAGNARRSPARSTDDPTAAPALAARKAPPARPPTGHPRAAAAAARRGRSRRIAAAAPPLPATTRPARPPPSTGSKPPYCTPESKKSRQALSAEGREPCIREGEGIGREGYKEGRLEEGLDR